MSGPVLFVKKETPVLIVMDKMQSQKFSAVMVENDLGIPVGIITTEDLMLNYLDVLYRQEQLKNERFGQHEF